MVESQGYIGLYGIVNKGYLQVLSIPKPALAALFSVKVKRRF